MLVAVPQRNIPESSQSDFLPSAELFPMVGTFIMRMMSKKKKNKLDPALVPEGSVIRQAVLEDSGGKVNSRDI